tara:strand:+ start:340 stop:819 length:480 start_codon:yes stop_codon:yes gene_type:complete
MRNEKGQFMKGSVPWIKGRHPKAWNKGISSGFALHPENINKIPWNTGTKGIVKAWNKGKPGPRGEKAYNWRGGTSTIYQLIRGSKEYKEWRKKVYQRDNYTCQECNTRGGVLNADHIKPFSLYPSLRFKVDNGRTLCVSCHKKTDTFASKIHTYAKNSH